MTRTIRVAIVGSGLAGLTAAHLLVSSRLDTDVEFDVHLFEKVRYIYSERFSSLYHPDCDSWYGLVVCVNWQDRPGVENRRANAIFPRR
jgi:predicted NAD/FAD-dependent oxidoreductase